VSFLTLELTEGQAFVAMARAGGLALEDEDVSLAAAKADRHGAIRCRVTTPPMLPIPLAGQ